VAKPRYHIIVCTNTRPPGHPKGSCGEKGAQNVVMKFSEELERRNLFEKVLLTGSTCLGICSAGPVVVVYPDNVWYQGVTPDGAVRIIEEHIEKGSPVEDMRIPDSAWEAK